MRWFIGRREFLGITAACAASGAAAQPRVARNANLEFELSLVESSLTRSFAKQTFEHVGFPRLAKSEFGIEAVEYATEFFPKQQPNDKVLDELNARAGEHGVRQLLIAVDKSVRISDPDASKRAAAIHAARQWIDAASALGCHSIQVNPESSGTATEQQKRAADALAEVCQYAATRKINVLLGNYGEVSANAAWIEEIVKSVDADFCRTLPRISNLRDDSDFQNLARLVPLAKGITADAFTFDKQGNETTTDFPRAMRTIHEAGYHGYVGINYRGKQYDEHAGIRAAIALLERVRNAPR